MALVYSKAGADSAFLTPAAAPELIRDTMGTALVAGANVTITPDDGADTLTIAATGGTSTSQWAGKVIGNFGDSVTWYDGQYFLNTHVEEGTRCVGYQTHMRNELGCTTMNHGASGYTAPDVLSRIKSENIVNYDAITINAGSNDFWKSGALGVLQPRGGPFTATYYGALQEAIEYIRGVDPTIKIFLLTPIKGWHDASGAMTDVWSQAMVDVGKMYSVPVLDWYHCSGIDDGTKSAYIGDKAAIGYDLHPTNAGYERMGRTIVSFLRDEGYAVSGSKADYVPVGTGAQLVASHTVTNGSLIDSSAITLDIATDTFTSAAHGLVDGTVVSIANHYPEGNCPVTSVSSGTPLFVINAATDTFQLSATSGGATLDWTSAGGATAGHWSLAVGGDGTVTLSGISGTRFRLKVRGNMRGAGSCSPNITLNNASALGFVRPAPPAGHRTDQMFMDLDFWLDPDMDQWFASGRAGTWCRGPAGWISNVQNIITFSRRDSSWFNTNITSIAVGINSTGNGGYAHGTIFEVWTA